MLARGNPRTTIHKYCSECESQRAGVLGPTPRRGSRVVTGTSMELTAARGTYMKFTTARGTSIETDSCKMHERETEET